MRAAIRIGPLLCPSAMRTAAWRKTFPSLSLKIAHARFARVTLDDVADRFIRNHDLPRLHAVSFHLPANEYRRAICSFSSAV